MKRERRTYNSKMRGYIKILATEYIDSQITVAAEGMNLLKANLLINPNMKIRGFADLMEPPKKTLKVLPNKDSTVREATPILNYGSAGQMMVGYENTDKKMTSYLGFELETPKEYDVLISAKLVLSKEYSTTEVYNLDLYETSDDWQEPYITWRYKPDESEKEYLLSQDITTGKDIIEIDLFDYIEGKFDSSFSLLLETKKDVLEPITFGTKESHNAPYLEIIYYEKPKSANRVTLDSNMDVAVKDEGDLESSIEVTSNFYVEYLESNLDIIKTDTSSDIESSINISNTETELLDLSLEIERKDVDKYLDSNLIVPYISDLDLELEITRRDSDNDLSSSIVVQVQDKTDLGLGLEITKRLYEGDLDSSIDVEVKDSSSLDTELDIKQFDVNSQIESDMIVMASGQTDLETSFEIKETRDKSLLDISMIVRAEEESLLDSSLEIIRTDTNSDIETEIEVSTPYRSDIECSIEIFYVESTEEIESSIYIPFREDLNTELDIIKMRGEEDLVSSIDIERKDEKKDLESEIYAMAFWAEELDCSIEVDGDEPEDDDYAFII